MNVFLKAVGGTLLLGLLGGRSASASVIEIDPGVVGGPVTRSISFVLPKVDTIIDLIFRDMKHVEIDPADNPQHIAFFLHGPAAVPFTLFLSDEFGVEIPGTRGDGTVNQSVFGLPDPADLLVLHDLHYQSQTPSTPFPLGDYRLTILTLSSTWPRIGEWDAVPEPATLALIGLGLAGLGAGSHQRKPVS